MRTRLCPKCHTEMQPTYQPYELRCPNCSFWFDTYTGKPINLFGEPPDVINHDGNDYVVTGHRLGDTVEMCHKPRMIVLIIGLDKEKRRWLGRYIEPAGLDTLTVLTEDFLEYSAVTGQ